MDEPDVREVARDEIAQLDSGTTIGDKLILSRRHAVAILTGGATLAGVLGYGSGEAAAQTAAGQIGTSSEPIDAFLASVNGEGVVTDGDGTDRRVWVIANGASDPSGAAAEDIIFEEEA
jgi:hypothetical protein